MKNKFCINPIMKKDIVVGSRSIKMSLAIMGINGFLALIVLLVMGFTNITGSMGNYDYSSLSALFPILGCMECGLLSLIVPIITSGSISGERERQTLDIMLTTPVSPFSIALGKLGSAMMVVMMYMITSIPVMAIAFVLGGMSWWSLLGLFGMLLYIGIYVGSVGVFSSSVVKKSVLATILTIAIGFGIIIVTMVLFYVLLAVEMYYEEQIGSPSIVVGAIPLTLLLNPYTPFVDFLIRAMTNYGLSDIFTEIGDLSAGYKILYKAWIPVSVVLNLLIALGFLKLASLNISVTRNKKRRGR